jgi:hypothetical protein
MKNYVRESRPIGLRRGQHVTLQTQPSGLPPNAEVLPWHLSDGGLEMFSQVHRIYCVERRTRRTETH